MNSIWACFGADMHTQRRSEMTSTKRVSRLLPVELRWPEIWESFLKGRRGRHSLQEIIMCLDLVKILKKTRENNKPSSSYIYLIYLTYAYIHHAGMTFFTITWLLEKRKKWGARVRTMRVTSTILLLNQTFNYIRFTTHNLKS